MIGRYGIIIGEEATPFVVIFLYSENDSKGAASFPFKPQIEMSS